MTKLPPADSPASIGASDVAVEFSNVVTGPRECERRVLQWRRKRVRAAELIVDGDDDIAATRERQCKEAMRVFGQHRKSAAMDVEHDGVWPLAGRRVNVEQMRAPLIRRIANVGGDANSERSGATAWGEAAREGDGVQAAIDDASHGAIGARCQSAADAFAE